MSMETGERRTFNCVVKSKAQEEDGWKLTLGIAEFRSTYPVLVNRVPEALAATLEPGSSYPLVLERQNLKKNQDGTDKDRSKFYNWYWGYVELGGSPADVPQDEPHNEPLFGEEYVLANIAEPPVAQPVDNFTTTDRSIMRQVALKAAVEWSGYHAQMALKEPITTKDVTRIAYVFNQFLLTAQVPAEDKGGE